jgi:hypothetical protein
MNSQDIRDNIIIKETKDLKEQFQLVANINIGFVHTIKNWTSPPQDMIIKAEMQIKNEIVKFLYGEISDDLERLRMMVTNNSSLTFEILEQLDQLIKKVR